MQVTFVRVLFATLSAATLLLFEWELYRGWKSCGSPLLDWRYAAASATVSDEINCTYEDHTLYFIYNTCCVRFLTFSSTEVLLIQRLKAVINQPETNQGFFSQQLSRYCDLVKFREIAVIISVFNVFVPHVGDIGNKVPSGYMCANLPSVFTRMGRGGISNF